MELPLSRKDCALAVSYHNSKRKEASQFDTKRRDLMSFESLEAHCASLAAAGQTDVILAAEGLGRGGEVRLEAFKVNGFVSGAIGKGVKVNVIVKKLSPETKSILLELLVDSTV